MVFPIRQLTEKTIEHQKKLFLLFIDIRKAYDSISHALLWRALEKLGVLDTLISLVRSFHEGMQAWVRVNGDLLEEISVENGLR